MIIKKKQMQKLDDKKNVQIVEFGFFGPLWLSLSLKP